MLQIPTFHNVGYWMYKLGVHYTIFVVSRATCRRKNVVANVCGS